MVATMKLEDVRNAIKGSEGKIFRVEFIRRTDSKDGKEKAGMIRTMVCRIGVAKGITGKGLAFDPDAKGLCTVWDMAKEGYRMVNLDTVVSIRLAGQEYDVVTKNGINETEVR
jgi:hypothetical protein